MKDTAHKGPILHKGVGPFLIGEGDCSMATLTELRREARAQRVQGRSTMAKAQLEKVLGYFKGVPPHLSFKELLALDYERFAVAANDLVRHWETKLATYADPPYGETDVIRHWRHELDMARRDREWACAAVAHYRGTR